MDKLKKFSSDLTTYNFFWLLIANLLGVGAYICATEALHIPVLAAFSIALVVAAGAAYACARLTMLAATQPLRAIWQAIWHISPNGVDVSPPNIDTITHGKEVADALISQIYELSGSMPQSSNQPQQTLPTTDALFDFVPLPLLAVTADGKLSGCNKAASDYFGFNKNESIGLSLYDVVHLSFPGNETLENWLVNVRDSNVTATTTWDRARAQLPDDGGLKQFDFIARFSKGDPNGHETLLVFFDHTEKYSSEDSSTSYVALAVHELRTPLTVLRGYIEVFEDELDSKLTPELRDFMHKMSASAQTLTAFVSNILNVARVDENQLVLSLHETNWNELLPQIAKDLELRAQVRGKNIVLDMMSNLPTVAVDKVSIYEVVSNLVENAVKYSGEAKDIIIHASLSQDGMIETVVEDHGVGIPASAINHLFTKFYRSHRSKGRVGGSGLGLYLVKAIVTAHGGNVWVQSQEGEGSRFGFTLQPYARVATELKEAPGGNIERQAHGWIKNHSMYRR